ncbi:MAG TPA: c-type cytochrome [Pyrinomonadaceae bacterium]|nr:c-type cytochrome [Pyrinomonadaceae bacterium]
MKLTVLRSIIVALTCAGAIIVIGSLRAPQASTEQKNFEALYEAIGMPAPPQTGATEKTVEQVEKNIKVLNGMPASQIVPVMNYFAASMGRRCNYCHVNTNGQWDYAADTKPEKNTAREMIKLVLDVNKNSFKGEPQVGCYTCHRGRNNPQSVPTLPLALPSPPPGGPGGGGGGQAPGAQPQGSPSPRPTPIPADDIINKYVTAIGGQAAIDKIKSRSMKGTIAGANGQTMSYESNQSGPDKAYEMFKTGQGTMERAINGATGWEKNPQGVHELTGGQFTQVKQQSALFRNLKLKEQYTRLRVAGRDKVGDRDAIVVLAATADSQQERLYFDAENGLLLRRVAFLRTMVGVIPTQTDFSDYRDVDGVKFPFTIVTSSINVGSPISTTKFDEIKLNPAVDDSKFKMPAAAAPANP